jgi:prepilin-type N-terminal cleavage/methylation domain-containing protein
MSSPLTHGGRGAARAAFTLIELLTVIAIIGLLAALTFGAVTGVQRKAKLAQARTELATLAQALEAYKKQYGDYPWAGAFEGNLQAVAGAETGSGRLFNALLGKLGPRMAIISGKQSIDVAKLKLQGTDLPSTGVDTADNAFVDPWGNLYAYYYKSPAAFEEWRQSSYMLVSAGPDQQLGIRVSAAGIITEDSPANAADNLYANK